ncbi:MAG: serine protease [Patescibacteria group bacterium]|nr:serine protease [Patescibacteria group bacterium]
MALLNKLHLNALVSIETKQGSKFNPIATGYLVGFLHKWNIDPKKRTYRVFLVTNRHVFQDVNKLWLRFNKRDSGGIARFDIDLKSGEESKWLAHNNSKVDLAMIPISPAFLDENNVEWLMYNEEMFAFQRSFEKVGISLGDGIFVLGFPMGLSGLKRNYAIVRSGSIARIDKEVIRDKKAFLIDTLIFPGNSGGPVLLKPELASLSGTSAVSSVHVLGTVSGYIPYKEPLFSHQSQPPSIGAISIENSGLAYVVPMDYARQIYKEFLRKNKKLEKLQEGQEKSISPSPSPSASPSASPSPSSSPSPSPSPSPEPDDDKSSD